MSLGGEFQDCWGFYVDTKFLGAGEDSAGQFRLQFLGTIAEISLRSAHMRGVGHRIFTTFGQPEHTVGKHLFLFITNTIAHNI